MSSNFNFYVNRQGVQGKRGAKGEQGFSPVISVESQTANEYILKVENEDGSFTTPNLRGNAIENNGGTYIRFNPDTGQMYTGYADGATTEQAGVVKIGTYEDLVAGESEEVVPNVADVHNYVQNSIGSIGGVVTTEQFNTYTSETAITLDNLENNKLDKSTFDSYTSATNSTLESLSTNKVNTSTFDSYVNSTSSTLNTLESEKLDFTNLANSLVQGENVTLTTDTANKTITISSSGGSKVQSNWTETDSTNPSFIQNKPTLGTMAAEDASDYTPSAGLSDVAISGSYNDLLNKPDIPAAANNATITITQGGVTKGSFTTDQGTNGTIDIDAVSSSLSAGNGININTNDEIDIMQEDNIIPATYNWDFNTIGTLTENNGVYSGFSSSNYLKSKTTFTGTNATSVEGQLEFTTGASTNGWTMLMMIGRTGIAFRTNTIEIDVYYSENSDKIFSNSSMKLTTNTTYILNYSIINNRVSASLTNKATGVVESAGYMSLNAGAYLPSNGHVNVGIPNRYEAFTGSINTNNSYIKIDGSMIDMTENPSQSKYCAKATSSLYGLVKPDNDTITVSNGVIEVDQSALTSKQDTLVSGTTIKTINSTSLLGSGDVSVQPTLVSGTNIKTINGTSVLGSGDITTGNVSSTSVNNIVQITQADYDALATKDANTQYIITDAPSLALADLSNVPASKGILTESYVNGTSWYRVYSDGWCEQGGYFNPSSSSSDWVTQAPINFLKPFANTNWHIVSFPLSNNSVSGVGVYLYGKTTDNFTLRTFNVSADTTMYWEAKGYI